MAIVEKFYNNDRARDIRELITQNFTNVARYIPNNFIVLTTLEKQNLTDDYKTHFKLVFDKEMQRVYRWSEIQRNWEQYLIYAWDEYARTEANTNADMAFTEVVLGKNISGANDPYTFTFYSRDYNEVSGADGTITPHTRQARYSVSLTGDNVKFNDEKSVRAIIQQLLDDLSSLDDFVGNRDDILNNSDLTATTVAGAIKEVNNKTIDNKTKIDNILSGITKVPEAIHAEHSDLADRATIASDSELFDGQPSEYYAKQSALNSTNELLNSTINRVSTNETNISNLRIDLNTTNANLQTLDEKVDDNYDEFLIVKGNVESLGDDVGKVMDDLVDINTRIGWQILYV